MADFRVLDARPQHKNLIIDIISLISEQELNEALRGTECDLLFMF